MDYKKMTRNISVSYSSSPPLPCFRFLYFNDNIWHEFLLTCCLCVAADGSVFPMKIASSQRGSSAPTK